MREGDVIDDRYVLERKLGEGGYGRVWLAVDELEGGSVAIKQVRPPLLQPSAQHRKFAARVRREAEAASPCSTRRGRVFVRRIVRHKALDYLVMDYVDGPTLREVLVKHRPLRLATAASVAVQLLDALESVHAENLIHRDVKPENLIVNRRGEVWLIDFGIVASTAEGATKLTETGFGQGTLGYIPPEQAKGEEVMQSDLHAVGVLLYEMLTGDEPFSDDNDWGLAGNRDYQRLLDVVAGIPAEVDSIVDRALAEDPRDRQETAAAMRASLAPLLPEKGDPAHLLDPKPDPTRPFREPDGSAGFGEQAPDVLGGVV